MALNRVNSGGGRPRGLGSLMKDGWKDYYPPMEIPEGYLIVRGRKRSSQGGTVAPSSGEVISDGSIICVGPGQSALVLDSGRVTHFFDTPGEHEYRSGASSIFSADGIAAMARDSWRRFTFGGVDVGYAQQAVLYVKTTTFPNISLGSSRQVMPIHVKDKNTGTIVTGSLICSGQASLRIADPKTFFRVFGQGCTTSVSIADVCRSIQSELRTVTQAVACRLASQGLRPFETAAIGPQLSDQVKDLLSRELRVRRGLEIVSLELSNFTLTASTGEALRQMQAQAALADPDQVIPTMSNSTNRPARISLMDMPGAAGFSRTGEHSTLMDMPGAEGFSRVRQNPAPEPEPEPEPGGFFETDNPLPLRLRDDSRGLDVQCGLLCEGFFSYRITDKSTLDAYRILAGGEYALTREMTDTCTSSMRFNAASMTEKGISPAEIPTLVEELRLGILDRLTTRYERLAGIRITAVELTVYSVTLDGKVIASSANSPAPEPEKPAQPEKKSWICSCGQENHHNFCTSCGLRRPAGKCPKCGYIPENPAKLPKFCPECGTNFNE